MNVQPQLEELEDRMAPTAADLAAFQQQRLPQLQVQFNALVPIVQSTLQTDLNHLEALAPLFPTPFQPLLSAVFAQEQQFVNAFPALANVWFQQTVSNLEAQLLAQPAVSPPPPAAPVAVFAPGFFPFFLFPVGFLGFPGVAPFAGGGGAFTSGFTGGTSGFTAGSGLGSGDPPTVMGRGMGIGVLSMVGALTLPQSNHL
jgi:hypothetical protein